MSLARQHRDRHLAQQTASAPAPESGLAPAPTSAALDAGSPAERASAQMALRLQHDLRTLKDVQSIERRVDLKRTMLPEYQPWLDGLLAGDAAPTGLAAEVLPVCMVWSIDTGDWTRALQLAAHVLEHDVPMPGRYQRQPAVLVAEEVAEAALKTQNAGAPFPLDVLQATEALVAERDMPDQVRAKLIKAIAVELARVADDLPPGTPAFIAAAQAAVAALQRAQALNDRIGVKERLKRFLKALAPPPATNPAGTPPPA